MFYQEKKKEETQQSSTELTGTQQLGGSNTEDLLDHSLVSANRCSDRTASISSSTENIKPSFTKKLKFQSVLEGEPVEIKCKLVACPQPTILWFHNNKSISKERRRRISSNSKMHLHATSLVIDSIKEKDSGSYKVMAINTEGSAESTASLLVSLREEQSANFPGFVKCSAKANESIDTTAEQRKETRFRVDLRCVGSPFDKLSKVHQGRSRSRSSLVRTVYFKSGSHAREKEVEKESKRLETASERALSPPPMFDRSERFNDRFSDIYCDQRTNGRFSDKFSDRCSDRYSERFSDTESLHSEVRTKLTTLQKAVKQRKRLSISTMSSSEMESESVASESSYADYVERLRVKPDSLPDVQQFNRAFDSGESHREFPGTSSKRDPSRPHMRHLFEPQSRTRAIQIMRGELVDTLVPETERKSDVKYSDTLEHQKAESFVESRADDGFKRTVSEHHSVVSDQTRAATKVEVELRHPEVAYSETLAYPKTAKRPESRDSDGVVFSEEEASLMESATPELVTSTKEKFLREVVTREEEATETIDSYEVEGAGESVRAQYEKSLDVERMQCEEKLLALRIRKWQQGSRMSEEDTFQPKADLPMSTEMQYMETEGRVYPQQEAMEKAVNVSTGKVKDRGGEVKVSASLLPNSDLVEATSEQMEVEAALMPEQKSPRKKPRVAKVEAFFSLRTIEAKAEERLKECPRPRQVKSNKERFLGEAVTPDQADPYEDEGAGKSLRAQYEKSLEAERMQCEEKLLALRIRKWQHGMRMSEEEVPHPEADQPTAAQTQYMEPDGHIFSQQEVEKKATVVAGTTSTAESLKSNDRAEQDETPAPLPETRIKARPEIELEKEIQVTTSRLKSRAMEAESSPRTKARAEKMLSEKTSKERELQLSRENISELKNESEKFVSEEEALTQRIMKWQENVQFEQEQAAKPVADRAEGYSNVRADRTTEDGRNVPEQSALESDPHVEVGHSKKSISGKTAKEMFLLSDSVPPGFPGQRRDKEGDPLTEGRETRLQRDSEYFVSEEEAMAQRILKWQQDVVEPEEVAELESQWGLDNQCKQLCPGFLFESYVPEQGPHRDVLSHKAQLSDLPPPHADLAGRASQTKTASPFPHASGYEPSPTQSGLPHCAAVSMESSDDYKSISAKDKLVCEASQIKGYSPTLHSSVPFEGYGLASSFDDKASRDCSSVRSPQEDLGGKVKGRRNRDEHTVTIDEFSSQRFQSERVDRREEMGTTERNEWEQEKDFEGVRKEKICGDSLRSKWDGEISAEKKEEGKVPEQSNPKERVPQMEEPEWMKEGITGGSRPVFVKEISSFEVKIGEMSEFTCQFQGDPLPTVTWLKNGHPLAHNPDYDIMSKSNNSKLTVFYPTTDHEGSYDCEITNKHGKSVCNGSLTISDKKVSRASVSTQKVIVRAEKDKGIENPASMVEAEHNTYMDSSKATLQVPQVGIHGRRCSDESFDSSPVEIRITAATPLPEIREEAGEAKPTEKTSDVQSDEGAPQTVKHKFTFSFDVSGEAPQMACELENTSYSELVQFSEGGRVRGCGVGVTKDVMNPAAFHKGAIAHTEDGVTGPRDKSLSLEAPTELAEASKASPCISKEPPTFSGCGLPASSAVIKVSRIKQAFEPDSPVALLSFPQTATPASEKSVCSKSPVAAVTSQTTSAQEGDRKISVMSGDFEEEPVLAASHGIIKLFVEEVQESPHLVRPKALKPTVIEQMGVAEVEVGDNALRTFDRTSSFIPFQSEKVPAIKRSVRTSAPAEEVVKPKDTVLAGEELISIPEPSMESGIFLNMPESIINWAEVAEDTARDVPYEIEGEDERIEVHLKPNPKPLLVNTKVDSKFEAVFKDAAEESQSLVASLKEAGGVDKAIAAEAGGTAAAVGYMEEEEVTFDTVYDFYNPPADWGRPLSPESEMSIEIGSTVSEELAEAAERFYTPGSSSEVSQHIVQSFHTPKSHMSFHTPSSDIPGGFITPQEFPFSPADYKRPSSGDSSKRLFSPVQFLSSACDEGVETTPLGMNVDDNRYHAKGIGSLGLATLQEKVQGIPPAFLKPLVKKRVFESDSLTFYAEVFGLPSPEVKWFCNKTQLVEDSRLKIERDGDSISLTIHQVQKADQGEYICEAVNYIGEARSVALVVVVSQEVRFMPALPAVTHQHVMEFNVEEDDSSRSTSPQEILLEVELDENEVKEFERQVKIITIPEYTADNKSMIISLDVLPSIYEECAVDFVTQEHDDLKIAFEVTEMPPRFINPICDMESPEGTTVMFECSLMGIPSPIVSWFKGDKKIPHNNQKYLHFSDADNHFLKIFKVETQDGGGYTCRAINVVGETLCRASLVVLNGKAFSGKTRGRELTAVSLGSAKVQPQKFDLVVGNTAFDSEQVSEIELEFEFEQEAEESQRAVRLVAKTDSETSEQGERYVSVNFDVFAEPAKDNKIEFKGKSSDVCSFRFQVTETSPKCVIPLTDVAAAAGTPVVLQCLVSGKPSPTAGWFKDGDRVTDGRCIIQEKTPGHFNLLITNVSQSDAGEYKCVIQNSAGCIETAALLKVF